MLSDSNIEGLSRGKIPGNIPAIKRDLSERRWRNAWWDRHGWNLPNAAPPMLPSENTVIKKVGVHEVYDVRRWMWKANDGIRETTWPGVYNMSRLPGRYDYFVLPDWDCYSMSGQSIEFILPDEPWNHVEIWGKAWGQLTYIKEHTYDHTFGVRSKEQVKSYHRLKVPGQGGILRFDNALIEEPIGELGVYHVHIGSAPDGSVSEVFSLGHVNGNLQKESIASVAAFIDGRYPADELTKIIGLHSIDETRIEVIPTISAPLPFIHIIIPYTSYPEHGLDGVEIEIPALTVDPTHGEVFPPEYTGERSHMGNA